MTTLKQPTAEAPIRALLGTKLGMTQIWDEDGVLRPVTVVRVDTNVVTQIRTLENDGYEAVQTALRADAHQPPRLSLIGHVGQGREPCPKTLLPPGRSRQRSIAGPSLPGVLLNTLRHYLVPYRGLLLAVLLLKIIETAAALSLPTLNADIINKGVVAGDTAVIWSLGAQMLALTTLQGAAAVVGTYFASKSAMGLGRHMRADIFAHVQRFSVEEISRFGAPSLITRSTNDIQQVQSMVFMIASMMLMAPIMLVGGIVMALRVDVPLSGLLIVLIPLLLIVLSLITRYLLPYFRVQQSRIDRLAVPPVLLMDRPADPRVLRLILLRDFQRTKGRETLHVFRGSVPQRPLLYFSGSDKPAHAYAVQLDVLTAEQHEPKEG